MATLTVTSRGQVTFRKEVLQHLGIQPGEKIELDLLPTTSSCALSCTTMPPKHESPPRS